LEHVTDKDVVRRLASLHPDDPQLSSLAAEMDVEVVSKAIIEAEDAAAQARMALLKADRTLREHGLPPAKPVTAVTLPVTPKVTVTLEALTEAHTQAFKEDAERTPTPRLKVREYVAELKAGHPSREEMLLALTKRTPGTVPDAPWLKTPLGKHLEVQVRGSGGELARITLAVDNYLAGVEVAEKTVDRLEREVKPLASDTAEQRKLKQGMMLADPEAHRVYVTQRAIALALEARAAGKTVAEYEAWLDAKAKQLFEGCEAYTRRGLSGAIGIAETGKIRTCFETGRTSPAAGADKERRAAVEKAKWGIEAEGSPYQSKTDHCRYSYLTTEPLGADSSQYVDLERGGGMDAYGEVIIKLKPSVLARSTMTHGDSETESDRTWPQPMSALDGRALDTVSFVTLNKATRLVDATAFARGFHEMQTPGEITVDDIAEVIVKGAASLDQDVSLLQRGFAKHGIKVTVYRTGDWALAVHAAKNK
jgi:hypothetical protein